MNNEGKKPYRVFGYARASTDKQILSTAGQCLKMDGYFQYKFAQDPLAHKMPYYEDEGVSATKYDFIERPHGKRLHYEMEAGDHLMLAAGDRAFRNVADCAVMIRKWSKKNIVVHLCNHNVDTSTYLGVFMVQFLTSLAEMEGKQRSERQIQRNIVARKLGLPTTGPVAYGWRIQKRPKKPAIFKPHWKEREHCERVAHLYDNYKLSGDHICAIFDELKVRIRNCGKNGKKWNKYYTWHQAKAYRTGFPHPQAKWMTDSDDD
jgi:DNA invertase Pin-like site-specific DNA recombinase